MVNDMTGIEIGHNLPFLGGVIHQLRNWMSGIVGQSDMALSSKDPDEMAESLNLAIELSMRSSELLAAVSKFRNGKTGERETGDLARIGREVWLLTDNWLKEKGINTSQDLKPAPVQNADLASTRMSLLEDLCALIDKIPHGEMVEYKSGLIDNVPYVGLKSRLDRKRFPDENILNDTGKPGLRYKTKIRESGEFDLMIIVPPGA